MERRRFLQLAGGAAITWPLPAYTEPGTRLPLVAVLLPSTEEIAVKLIAALREGLDKRASSKDPTTSSLFILRMGIFHSCQCWRENCMLRVLRSSWPEPTMVKILRGTKPGDLPIERADKLSLVVNLKTAKALGLTVPDKVFTIADELID